MSRTKTDIAREVRLRRQRILTWLHANGPARRNRIAPALGIQPDVLTMDLALMQTAGQIVKLGKMGKGVTWRATCDTLPDIETDITTLRQKQQQTALLHLHQQREAQTIPGYRLISQLNKPASQTGSGGQCANVSYGSLQCGQNYETA